MCKLNSGFVTNEQKFQQKPYYFRYKGFAISLQLRFMKHMPEQLSKRVILQSLTNVRQTLKCCISISVAKTRLNSLHIESCTTCTPRKIQVSMCVYIRYHYNQSGHFFLKHSLDRNQNCNTKNYACSLLIREIFLKTYKNHLKLYVHEKL